MNNIEDMEGKDYVKKEQSDWSFCENCQYRFADLEKQEQECKTCLFYLLQED
jgi:hypothetical protein